MVKLLNYYIDSNYESFVMKAIITSKKDYNFLERIFKDLLLSNLNISLNLYNDEPPYLIAEKGYPLNKEIIITYNKKGNPLIHFHYI